jgi:hypothetical protein
MRDLPALLDQLEQAGGPPDPVPSADGWELVLAENVAYLVDDQRRWHALAELRTTVGLAPEQILAAPESVLRAIVIGPGDRVQRLRRCAELAIAGAPWRAYPGIGQPGQDRIDYSAATASSPAAARTRPARPAPSPPPAPAPATRHPSTRWRSGHLKRLSAALHKVPYVQARPVRCSWGQGVARSA